MRNLIKIMCLTIVIAGGIYATPPGGTSCLAIFAECKTTYGVNYAPCTTWYARCVSLYGNDDSYN